MTGLPATVVVASNRAAAGVYDDTTGPLIVAALRELGFEVGDPVVRPDGAPVGDAIRAAVAAGARVVLTTGGTGLTPTDRTPEETRPPPRPRGPRPGRGGPRRRHRQGRADRGALPRARGGRRRLPGGQPPRLARRGEGRARGSHPGAGARRGAGAGSDH
ncbi:molybdopterin-binding protein [Nocardioides sp. TF02-7]|uniref:molybdopterin-binding protein n=1 Tax=Nocardioides sp. TF02-7 TaxID=2917724 RepID=UPI0031F51FD4